MLWQKNFFGNETPQGVPFASNLKKLLLTKIQIFLGNISLRVEFSLNFYERQNKSEACFGTVMVLAISKFQQKIRKKPAKFLFLEVFAEKSWQFLPFNGFSLQIEYVLPEPQNFEKSLL